MDALTQASAALPGMTRNFGNPCTDLVPQKPLCAVPAEADRRVILLATATITEDNLFSNGLFQNVYVLYKMFDAMGYAPMLVIHEKPKSEESIPPMLRGCRMRPTEQIITNPLPVAAMIEIGMSVDPLLREFVKMLGGKLVKLYLGNILNIDVETPMFYPQMHFAHHVIEKIDRIWTSPHYGQHAEYAAYLNHVQPPRDLNDMIAPYVWDPVFITRGGTLQLRWRPRAVPEDDVIVIMEPNISMQKAAFCPLLAVERWYRAGGRSWKGKVVVINGERVQGTPHFSQSIEPALDLCKDGRVEFLDRRDMVSTMKAYPSAIFVCHNINNEYNYMALELLHCGFPVVHNSQQWTAFGYTYHGNNIAIAAERIQAAYVNHASRLETYEAHARTLEWRHSPYNPEVHAAWEALLKK